MSQSDISRYESTVRRLLVKLPDCKGKVPTKENQLILQDMLLQALCYLRGETELVLTLGDLTEKDQEQVFEMLVTALDGILHKQEMQD